MITDEKHIRSSYQNPFYHSSDSAFSVTCLAAIGIGNFNDGDNFTNHAFAYNIGFSITDFIDQRLPHFNHSFFCN